MTFVFELMIIVIEYRASSLNALVPSSKIPSLHSQIYISSTPPNPMLLPYFLVMVKDSKSARSLASAAISAMIGERYR